MSEIGGPVVLAVGLAGMSCSHQHEWRLALSARTLQTHHQRLEILLQPIIIQTLERLGIVQLAIVRIAGRGVLTQDVEPQLVRPPVLVLYTFAEIVESADGESELTVTCRPPRTFLPPMAVLASRMGHFAGSPSAALTMVKSCYRLKKSMSNLCCVGDEQRGKGSIAWYIYARDDYPPPEFILPRSLDESTGS